MGMQDRVQKILLGLIPGGIPKSKRRVVAKTANYTVLNSESGTVFTTQGASGAVTFTLPALEDGLHFWFFNAEDQDMIVASASAGEMALFNDVAANSIAFSTVSEQVGGGMYCVCDGTQWYTFVNLGAETQTPTIAT